MKHIVGFSGGIDSQAAARWVLNRYPAQDVILLNSLAGRNEHPLTEEFIAWYSGNVHPVVQVVPLVRDLYAKSETIEGKGLAPDTELTFELLARLKGRFPARRSQFCTTYLKLEPSRRWIDENITDDYCRYVGVRRDESVARHDVPEKEWDELFDCMLYRPVVDWTKPQCFRFIKDHEGRWNELYDLGFTRVGCAPCVNSGKEDILRWAQRFPAMIDKVRGWEERTKRTFFPPTVPGKHINWVDEVVSWAGTVHGGRQLGLHVLETRGTGCENKWGFCE